MKRTELCEIAVSYKPPILKGKTQKISTSSDTYYLLLKVFDPDLIAAREEFIILYLNRSNRVLGYFKAFTGGVGAVVCDPKIVLGVALKGLASSIILAHNHPSGNLKPSQADISLTKKIKHACEFLEISLLDHLILSPDGGYYSFADEGML